MYAAFHHVGKINEHKLQLQTAVHVHVHVLCDAWSILAGAGYRCCGPSWINVSEDSSPPTAGNPFYERGVQKQWSVHGGRPTTSLPPGGDLHRLTLLDGKDPLRLLNPPPNPNHIKN